MNQRLRDVMNKSWAEWHKGLPEDLMPDKPNASFEMGFKSAANYYNERYIKHFKILVHLEVMNQRFLQGFKPRRTEWDDLLEELIDLLGEDDKLTITFEDGEPFKFDKNGDYLTRTINIR